ncbi:hypothetical protein PCASD_09153 [Puccinia coronata f. sp. avenae]|uniref:Uncharacterized protein n=1 Tax=Puccinia coronata f. sp. avenae TaxID=200324 RepID=A0A2N5V4F7_9BASI|nr:hypothetical protein PCASD_09153 [Puccinia coronata f. sp. avenae]
MIRRRGWTTEDVTLQFVTESSSLVSPTFLFSPFRVFSTRLEHSCGYSLFIDEQMEGPLLATLSQRKRLAKGDPDGQPLHLPVSILLTHCADSLTYFDYAFSSLSQAPSSAFESIDKIGNIP